MDMRKQGLGWGQEGSARSSGRSAAVAAFKGKPQWLVAKMQKVYAQRIECPAWLSLSQQLSRRMSELLPSWWIGINNRREGAAAAAARAWASLGARQR
jgi:hypothetical protein